LPENKYSNILIDVIVELKRFVLRGKWAKKFHRMVFADERRNKQLLN
jgi:hypothetical protein